MCISSSKSGIQRFFMKKVLILSSMAAVVCASVYGKPCEPISKIAVADFTATPDQKFIGFVQTTTDDAKLNLETIESSELNFAVASKSDATLAVMLHDTETGQIIMQHKFTALDENQIIADTKQIAFQPEQNGSYSVFATTLDNDCAITTAMLKSDGTHMQLETMSGEPFELKDPMGKAFSLTISTTSFNPVNLAAISAHETHESASA